MKILISGATKGLGLVTAIYLKNQGHEVITIGRSNCSLTFDFTKPKEWDCIVPEVDAVIHCAGGGLGLRGPLLAADPFYDLFMTNLGGQAEINRFVLPEMMFKKQGFIVHICSIASGEAIGSVGYNTMKAALAAYVRSLGREMAPYGVVVSGIAPGGFTAPGNAMERLEGSNPSAYAEFVNQRLPRGFMGKAEELLPMITFLISKEASMMGGCVVPMDAGEGRYY